MAIDRVLDVMNAIPILGTFGYGPTQIAVLLVIASNENKKLRDAAMEEGKPVPLKAWSFASIKRIAWDANVCPRAAVLTLSRAKADGLIDVIGRELRQTSYRRINDEAFKALLGMRDRWVKAYKKGLKMPRRDLYYPRFDSEVVKRYEAEACTELLKACKQKGEPHIVPALTAYTRDMLHMQ